MCPVYELCEVCDVDHYYEDSPCPWYLTARTIFYLDLHPDHPFVPDGLRRIEEEIEEIIADDPR